jgi:adenine-specific DNA-methyltransferase
MRNDQVFTPPEIVTKMLDMIEYTGDNIRYKTIFEPSFGGGAFLLQIVDRIFDYADDNNLTTSEIIKILDNIHGVEVDKKWYDHTIELLKNKAKKRGIAYDWNNLLCTDTTKLNIDHEYDLVIMNPPYIKVWDMSEQDRIRVEADYRFCKGNTDMYIVFFELGMKALKCDGKLCCISPNSFLRNSSQKDFRKHLADNELVESITDYGIVPVFGKVATYTAITLLDMAGNHEETRYTMMKDIEHEAWANFIKLSTFGEKQWAVASSTDDTFLKDVASRKTKLSDLCDIQYGLATNADKIYLVDRKDVKNFESEILKPVVKGSTLAYEQMIIFPYEFDEENQKYALIEEERLKNEFPKTYRFLYANKTRLEIRDLEKGAIWYQYGRSQGIQNSRKCKFVLKHIVAQDDKNCHVIRADDNTLVYSGMFITMKREEDAEIVRKTLMSNEFCRYVKLIGKNMAGGYKSFNTAAVKNFGIDDSENDYTEK